MVSRLFFKRVKGIRCSVFQHELEEIFEIIMIASLSLLVRVRSLKPKAVDLGMLTAQLRVAAAPHSPPALTLVCRVFFPSPDVWEGLGRLQ